MASVGIIGFGRFGKVLYDILRKGYTVRVYELNPPRNQEFSPAEFVDWETLLQEEEIFVAVPINRFQEVIEKMAPSLGDTHTIIDVCSVKMHPLQVMEKHLPRETGFITTHPLFGPDSYIERDSHPRIMMHSPRPCATDPDNQRYNNWKDFFQKQGFSLVEMTPEEHDRLAANTQGLTHYLGRFLKEYGIKKTPIDTRGFSELLNIVDQTCNDTWELYLDLQRYNPFTREMIERIDDSIRKLNEKAKLL